MPKRQSPITRQVASNLSRRLRLERLEDRRLLSGASWNDYTHVAAEWFARMPTAEAAQVESLSPVQFADGAAAPQAATSSTATSLWIVRFTAEALASARSVQATQSLLNGSAVPFRVLYGLGLPGLVLVEAGSDDEQAVTAALGAQTSVASFERDRPISVQTIPDDSEFADQWYLNNTGQAGGTADADIDAPEAWNLATGSRTVVVGVIDSGIDLTHRELYQNIWINQGEIPAGFQDVDLDGLITFHDLNCSPNVSLLTDANHNGRIDAADLLPVWSDHNDNDGNYYVDDLFGWDFANGDNNPTDDFRHGTHVAGTIAAVGNNGEGVAGVCWSASLMALKVLDSTGKGDLSAAVAAMHYASLMRQSFDVNLLVTNNSWGYRGELALDLAVALQSQADAGILVVAAAGNGDALGLGFDNDADASNAFYPASAVGSNILSVAATGPADQLVHFSNYGSTTVDLAAPGVGIISTEPGETYASRNGTSMAAPQVTGVAALLWSQQPQATVAEIRQAILLGVDPVAGLAGKVASGGRLNAYGALLVDTMAPRAELIAATDVSGPVTTPSQITVAYTDNRQVVAAAINGSELIVTRLWDGQVMAGLTLQSVDVQDSGRRRVATYQLAAPGGNWDATDQGDYQISLKAQSVYDPSYNYAASQTLGSFNVDTTVGLLRGDVFDDGTGTGTLRTAVVAANAQPGANTIRLKAGTYRLSIPGSGTDTAATGDLDITENLVIFGAGADKTVLDAAGLDRFFHIHGGATVELRDVSVRGGAADFGGAILVDAGGVLTLKRVYLHDNTATSTGGAVVNRGTLTIEASTLAANTAPQGGGLQNEGVATLVNATISGNTSTASGGGINNSAGAQLTLTNVTIANNTAATGGGLKNAGTATLTNTLLADNSAAVDADASGAFASTGHNLIASAGTSSGWIASDLLGVAALLGSLGSNGGTTPTHALLAGSPAIDAGDNTLAPATDQCGIARPQDANQDGTACADIGAVERFYGEIHGVRFHDLDGDQVRDLGEPPLPGLTMYLDLNRDGFLDPGEPTAVTGSDGSYSFVGVPPGGYVLAELLEPGWTSSAESATEIQVASHDRVWVARGDAWDGPSISTDGRYVVFVSTAPNLVPGGTPGVPGVFVYDAHLGTIERLTDTLDVTGSGSLDDVEGPAISGNGRYVVFSSRATNLVPGDTNGSRDVFLYDLQQRVINRISMAADGTQGDGDSSRPSISADGRYVAFESSASNLVPGDIVRTQNIYVYDRDLGSVERISVAPDGAPGNSASYDASISADGRYVAFASGASNLVPGDTNHYGDIFLYDRVLRSTLLVSAAADGTPANYDAGRPSISADGGYIAFSSFAKNLIPGDTNNKSDTFVYDRQEAAIERISVGTGGTQGNGPSRGGSISADGRFVVFYSEATNLVPDDSNAVADVFLYDRQQDVTQRMSVATDGTQGDHESGRSFIGGYRGSVISPDGRYVAFISAASNLVPGDDNWSDDIFLRDRVRGEILCASVSVSATPAADIIGSSCSSTSADGRYVAFVSDATNLVRNDTNGVPDVFVYDRQSGGTDRVSVASDGTQGDAESGSIFDVTSISADGRYVAFHSYASNLVPDDTNGAMDVFVFDRQTRTAERVSVGAGGVQANGNSLMPSLSADGRYVAFVSGASNLVPGDTNGTDDVFVYDRELGTVERVSVATDGSQVERLSLYPSISADGRFVVFISWAENLVPDDTNGFQDAFVYDRQQHVVERVSLAVDGTQGNNESYIASISADGRFVVFASLASNLVPNDTNNTSDVFVYDRQRREMERVSVATDGTQGNDHSDSIYSEGFHVPSISADGRYVAFSSAASNLVPGDDNETTDVFVYDRRQRSIELTSVAADGTQGNSGSSFPTISADGRYVAFSSGASNLLTALADGSSYAIFVRTALANDAHDSMFVLVATGESLGHKDFSDVPGPGQIRGRVFEDRNVNQSQDGDEPGLRAITVFLDTNGNGILDPSERSCLTDGYGLYAFDGLESPASHTVTVVSQNFWVQTSPSLVDGGVWTIELGAGELRTNVDFGLHYRGPGGQDLQTISGVFFQDNNFNGIRDAGEPALAGRTVYIDADNDGVLDTGERQAVTSSTGQYSFVGLPAGTYRLRAVPVAGWEQSSPLTNHMTSLEFGKGPLDTTQGLTVGDFSRDGFPDVAVANGNYLSLMINDGHGAFSATPQKLSTGADQWGATAVIAGYFNNDAYLDLAVTNFLSSTVSVLLGNGDGSFAAPTVYYVGVYPIGLTIGDFDHDSDVDLAVAMEYDGQVGLLWNQGNGTFGAPSYLTAGNAPFSLVAGQFTDDNFDGKVDAQDWLDLAVANFGEPVGGADAGNVQIIYNIGRSGNKTTIALPAGTNPASVAAADLDGDGDSDLAVANFGSGNVSILQNLGNGSFVRLPSALSAGSGPYSLSASDVDGDGRPDLLVANGDPGHLALLRNMSQGGSISFGPAESYGAGEFPDSISSSVAVSDLNKDAVTDVIVANGITGSVSVMLNTVESGVYKIELNGVTAAPAVNFGARLVVPPSIESWQSAADHGSLGETSLLVPDDGTFSEPRSGGVRRLLVSFSKAIDPATFTSAAVQIAGKQYNGSAVDLSSITINTSLRNGNTIGVIDFSTALPDAVKYTVRINGIKDTGGVALTGDNDRVFSALKGDSSGDGVVNAIDLARVRANAVNPISTSSAAQIRADLSLDGLVDSADYSWVRANVGHDVRGIGAPSLMSQPLGDPLPAIVPLSSLQSFSLTAVPVTAESTSSSATTPVENRLRWNPALVDAFYRDYQANRRMTGLDETIDSILPAWEDLTKPRRRNRGDLVER